MSPREQILADLAAALGVGAPAGTTVHRQPMTPIERDQLPALCLYALSFRPQGKGSGLRPYDLALRIEVRHVGREPDQLLEPWIAHVQRVLTRKPIFSNRVLQVEEGEVQYDAVAADKTYVAAALDYTATFLHDPSAQEEPFEAPPGAPLTEITYDRLLLGGPDHDSP